MTAADRLEALLADIDAGPAELAAVLVAQRQAILDVPLGALARPTWRLIGVGSSRFAGLDAASRLRADGRDAHAETASASGGSPGSRDTLVVAISASGRTTEVLAAAERHHGSAFVLGLTARADSALAEAADAVVPLAAAFVETAGISTLAYRAMVTALFGLSGDGEPDDTRRSLSATPAALREIIGGQAAWLDDAARILDGGRAVHVLGDGYRSGACEQAALMLREAPRIPAVAFDTGDWLHTGLHTLLPGDPVLIFAGSPADAEVISTIQARGGLAVVVGPQRDGADLHVPLPQAAAEDPVVRAVVEPVVAELLAAELWARTGAVTVSEHRTK
ncbi:MAG TPA: SIS domain-containing protein [Candidatus Limnocylindrales bacterium]|nr:SIS domain-containing protein [Candidatus Limnocylindrales bacterium]